jgi:hypothetical protein
VKGGADMREQKRCAAKGCKRPFGHNTGGYLYDGSGTLRWFCEEHCEALVQVNRRLERLVPQFHALLALTALDLPGDQSPDARAWAQRTLWEKGKLLLNALAKQRALMD